MKQLKTKRRLTMKKFIGTCFDCEHCQYHSEGDSYCDIDFEFVLEDWCPTDKFMNCKGKCYIKI